MALGACEALRERGLAVPDDVLLVGYDDIPLARYANPALTSVQGDMAAVGALAATRLLGQIEGRPAPEPATLHRRSPGLVVRRSCGCPPEPAKTSGSRELQSVSTQPEKGQPE